MGLRTLGQAAGMFAVTNIDDILVLALFFGQTSGRSGVVRVVVGQYLGFAAILVASIAGALGAGLLRESAIGYLGLLPLLLGLRAAWTTWRERRAGADHEETGTSKAGDSVDGDSVDGGLVDGAGPGVLTVAAVTLANGGDNVGVYVPIFTVAGPAKLAVFVAVFLVGVALWCAAGRFFATRPVVAVALSRWGHVLMPVVFVGIGALILTEGHAFGL
jgi:cadmium resistance protein CadD (predicted permease)